MSETLVTPELDVYAVSVSLMTVEHLDRLPQEARNSLTYLRSIRDALARALIKDVDQHEDAPEWIESMTRFENFYRSERRLRTVVAVDCIETYRERLLLFSRVCLRCARLEREALGLELSEDLVDA